MRKFLRLANEWLLPWRQLTFGPGQNARAAADGKKARRSRTRAYPAMESVEARVLLSAVDLSSTSAAASAEVFRIKRSPVILSGVSASGTRRGPASFTATLTSGGSPLAGKKIIFQVKGRVVGRARTDSEGVVTLAVAKLKGVGVGSHGRAVTARFRGDASHKPRTARGRLTVSRFSTVLGGVSASGVYNGAGSLTAALYSRGVPLAGQNVQFQIMGHAVGTATTNAQGVATLASVSVAGLSAGSYAGGVSASFVGNLTYQQNSASGNLTVGQAAATVTLGSLTSTYDGTAKAATANTSPSGLAVSLSYKDAIGNSVASPTAAGTYQVTGTITDSNYTGSTTGSLVIAPAAVSVSGITAASRVYDGTTAALLDTSGVALDGVVAGDQVSLVTAGASAVFASKDVGTGNAVTVSGLALSGADAGNYILTQPSTTADITPATLTVTGLAVASKAYDGTTDATLDTSGVVLDGAVSGDDVTLDVSGATATFDTKDVGMGINVTVSGLALAGVDAGNYIMTAPSTLTADITPAVLSVSGITAAGKQYDGTTDAAIDTSGATLTGVVSGEDVNLDTSGAVGTFDSKDAGSGKTVTVSGLFVTGADIGNYILGDVTALADISAATLMVDGITGVGKTYDGTTDAELDTSGASLLTVFSGDDVTLDTSGALGTFDTKDVGMGINVTVSGLALAGADAGNYILTQPTTSADITAATLTVTGLTVASKAYDGTTDATLDTSGVVLDGAVSGDDVTLDVSGATATFDTKDVGTGINVTVSGLALAGADAGNYILNAPSTLTGDITPAVLSVSGITATGKMYDGTTDAAIDTSGATLTGVVSGEDVNLDTSGAVGTFDSKDAGSGKTVTVSGLFVTGADIGNYILGDVTALADISEATLTVDGVTAFSKTYDGTTAAAFDISGATLNGVLSGDDVTLDPSGAVGTFDTKDVGIGINVTGNLALTGADAGNYILTQPTTTADITALTLTVTGITAADKAADGTTDATLDTSGATLLGVINGDDVTLDTTGAVGTFASADPGMDITVTISGLTISGADSGNYILTQPTTMANIT
jgi:trimeric autotransporter adhesin